MDLLLLSLTDLLPFHLLGLYLPSSPLAPHCLESGFGVYPGLAIPSLVLTLGHSINSDDSLTFKLCLFPQSQILNPCSVSRIILLSENRTAKDGVWLGRL